jgi:endoribonuclease Dicer
VAPHRSDDEDDGDSTPKFLRDPTTSSRIYPEDATTVVYRFASNVPRHGEGINTEQALFEFEDEQKEFDMPRTYICTVLLPETPVHRTSGPPSTSRAIARRMACYKVCEKLAKIGLLDYRLFPLPPNLEAKSEAAVDSSRNKGGTRGYLRKLPDFWMNTGLTSTALFYPFIISDYADEAMRPHSPFLILTRQPLPDLASFKLFFAGVSATVNFKRGAPFQLNDTRLTDLFHYTVRLVRIISNKPYVCSMADMVYFFAPLTVKWTSLKDNGTVLPNVVEHIPWDLVSLAGDKFVIPLKGGTLADMEQDIKGAVIQDRYVEFTRRYDAVRMRPDLTPLSKPLDSPVREFVSGWEAYFILIIPLQREAEHDSLLDFCKARRKNFDGLQDYGQPIIEVSKVPSILNRLNPTSRELTSSMKVPAKCMCMSISAGQ